MARSLLVGSLNLESPAAVFAAAGAALRHDVARVPDGETGERLGWIFSLAPRFAAVAALELAPASWGEHIDHRFDQYRPREGVAPEDVEFGNLGYADDAIASYACFRDAVEGGTLRGDTRFQVALPTAFMAVMAVVARDPRAARTPAYGRARARGRGGMREVIAAARLAIQWDTPCEVSITEAVSPPVTWSFDDAAAQVGRMAALVPDGVELGFHHCYGDPPDAETGHGKHWMEPRDAGAMVRLTNAMLDRIDRRVDWVHMPVPIERDDDDFFAPLRELRLPEETELYLGLVHFEDGAAGTQRRIDTAARHVASFGVATECGIGRIPRDEVVPTLEIHRDVLLPTRA